MINIAQNSDTSAIIANYPENSIERQILNILENSTEIYYYNSIGELNFELDMRREIIKASSKLYKSQMGFAVFRKAKCNENFWELTNNGGFKLKREIKSADAINDIFTNGHLYATECATAMVIVYYKALVDVLGEETFSKQFTRITLMNWSYLDSRLDEIGYMQSTKDPLPADRRYFANPQVDPKTPEWQGENTIDMTSGLYYGHGIGIHDAKFIITSLNSNRMEGATKSSYLMDTVSRPDFKSLYKLKAQ